MLPPIRELTEPSGIETPIETPLGGRASDAIRVLYVDDDTEFLELATTMLKRRDEHFDVVAERSAAAGLDQLGGDHIDCVVSDYQLPDDDGLQFLDRVRDQLRRRERGEVDAVSYAWTGVRKSGAANEVLTHGGTVEFRSETAILGILAEANGA